MIYEINQLLIEYIILLNLAVGFIFGILIFNKG